MKSLGRAGSAVPRAKVGDYDAAIAFMISAGDAKTTKARLVDLRDATAAHDKAREEAQAAGRKAAERDKAAHRAEMDATVVRQALADETAEARAALGKREEAVAGREKAATECEQSQEARDKELARREEHLSKAGVRGF